MTGEELVVDVNRDGPGTIAPENDALETRASFDLVLRNHGDPAHVHVRLDGPLARIASIDGSNFFVPASEETRVPVIVPEADLDAAVAGDVEVSTRYGATTTAIEVTLPPGPPSVDVDETLAKPPRSDRRSGESAKPPVSTAIDPGAIGLAALFVVAVLAAIVTASVVGGIAAITAVLVVASGIAIAVGLLVRD